MRQDKPLSSIPVHAAQGRQAMPSSSPPELDICDDPRFQRREWKLQRLFWYLMYAVLLAVMLGAMGKGMLSRASIGGTASSLHFEYERFLRYRAGDELRITFNSPYDLTRISFDRGYFRSIGIQRIFPKPKNILMTDETAILVFESISSEPMTVTITISPDHAGLHHGWIAVNAKARHPFKQFVYP